MSVDMCIDLPVNVRITSVSRHRFLVRIFTMVHCRLKGYNFMSMNLPNIDLSLKIRITSVSRHRLLVRIFTMAHCYLKGYNFMSMNRSNIDLS
jgi:hypothetical protein